MSEQYDFFASVEKAIATGENGRLEGCYAVAITLKTSDPNQSNKILLRLLEGVPPTRMVHLIPFAISLSAPG